MHAKAGTAANMLKHLANPSRLMVLCELGQGERSVGELESVVGLSQSALSQHLAKLRAAKLVPEERGQDAEKNIRHPAEDALNLRAVTSRFP